MKSRSTKIYSFFAILIYIFSIAYFFYSLYSELSQGNYRTNQTFLSLTNVISSRIENAKTPDQILNQNIYNFISDNKDILSFSIKKNNNPIISYPNEYSEVQSSNLIKLYKYSLNINNDIYLISANLYLLNPDSIYKYGKISFSIILIVTVITIFILIFENSRTTSKKEDDVCAIEHNTKLIEENSEQNENTATEKPEDFVNVDINTLEEKAEEIKDETKAEETEDETENKKSEASISSNNDNPEVQKIDIDKYVPEPIRSFLNNKIEQANKNNTETGIFVMNFLSDSFSQDELGKILNVIKSYFTDENSLTSYKDTLLLGIKPDVSLDDNLVNADKIISDIESLFPEKKINCYFGISNRNTRNIDSGRLLFEAEAAMNHAIENKEKVIAFRVNLKQYEKFIQENS